MHAEVEIYPAVGGELDFARVFRGRDGFRKWWERIGEGVSDLYTFRDDLIVRVDGFRTKAEALEAAGLPG